MRSVEEGRFYGQYFVGILDGSCGAGPQFSPNLFGAKVVDEFECRQLIFELEAWERLEMVWIKEHSRSRYVRLKNVVVVSFPDGREALLSHQLTDDEVERKIERYEMDNYGKEGNADPS